jgi:hypothetical protein
VAPASSRPAMVKIAAIPSYSASTGLFGTISAERG